MISLVVDHQVHVMNAFCVSQLWTTVRFDVLMRRYV